MSGAKRTFLIEYPRRGYSLVEVIVAVAIFAIGVIGILQFFPQSLRVSSEAALRGQAALIAQQKAEEIRRDDNQAGDLVEAISFLEEPTDPIPYPFDDRLTYQFHSRPILTDDPPPLPGTQGVPHVIVRYNPEFRPPGDVLFELRFDP